MATAIPRSPASAGCSRLYRLVDAQGFPHPVLDDLYDSLEAAWADARTWWQSEADGDPGPIDIAVEVSTGSGAWRTLRAPRG